MASISDAKVLGGIGSLLVLFTVVPNVGWVLGIAGFVMILFAIRNISEIFNDKKIFDNMLTAVILAVGAIGVGTITVVGSIYHILGMGSFAGSKFVLTPNLPTGDWVGLLATALAGILVVWAILVASAVFVRKSYTSIGSKLNVHMFETAGLLYLIGAATSIILVGFPIILIAEILLAVAFFSIPEQTRSSQTAPIQPNVAVS
jgi:uncharacterized membrane protein